MKETTLNLYALDYRDMRTYMVAMLFILGNMVLPQLCHLIPQGGITWLPIYFFTLIGAYKYGWESRSIDRCTISDIEFSVFRYAFSLKCCPVFFLNLLYWL